MSVEFQTRMRLTWKWSVLRENLEGFIIVLTLERAGGSLKNYGGVWAEPEGQYIRCFTNRRNDTRKVVKKKAQ